MIKLHKLNKITDLSRLLVLTGWCLFVILIVGAGNMAEAQDWSEEIRLTNTQSRGIYAPFFLKKDLDDNLHFVYQFSNNDNNDTTINRSMPVYQKFSRIGEPLTDPIPIFEIAEIPDTSEWGIMAHDLFLFADEYLYILFTAWGDRPYEYQIHYYTSIDLDGNTINRGVILDDHVPLLGSHNFHLVVDSNEILTFGGTSIFRSDSSRTDHVFYRRFTQDGEPIGNFRFIDSDTNERHSSMRLSSGDTLTFVWAENHDMMSSVHFSKVAPDDRIIIDDFEILPREDWRSVVYYDYELDSDNQLVIFLTGAGSSHVRKYNNAMDELFQTGLGVGYSGSKDLTIDRENNIHIGMDFRTPERVIYMGYSMLDNEGNLLDSAEIVIDRNQQPRGLWDDAKVYVCDDGFKGLACLDDRWGTNEIVLKYKGSNSVDDNITHGLPFRFPIIYSSFPNPFNSTTTIHYKLSSAADMSLKIFDPAGRLVKTLHEGYMTNGEYSVIWNADNIASGVYICRLEAGMVRDDVKMVVMR